MTKFELHVQEWTNCQRCELARQRQHVVIARGSVPADVVFVGEAPGDSEDVFGAPFVGPAGHLLDSIIRRAVPGDVTFALTNLVGCFPKAAKQTADHRPPDEAVRACAPRVADLLDICQPKVVVAVGKLAATWLDQSRKNCVKMTTRVPVFEIVHPAAILRSNVAAQGLMIQRATVTLQDAVTRAVAGVLRDGPPARVLKPKAKDIPARKVTKRTPAPADVRRSTFSPGAIGAPLNRCRVCKRPIVRPTLGPGPYCDAHRPAVPIELGPDGNPPPF